MKLKSELYKDEQIKLSNQIIDILELNENNQIILYNLDNDKEKQNKIMELIPELRKYFSFRDISGLEKTEMTKRPYLSIIRQITKLTHTLETKDKHLTVNGKPIRTRLLIFTKKN
jgi:hypothetical protein